MAKSKSLKSNSNPAEELPRHVNLYFKGSANSPAERMAAIRQLRKGQILNHLLNEGTASRVDISRILGFNLRTVSLLVASLIEDKVVVEKPILATTSMGRRPVPLELNPVAASILAIDMGRTVTKLVLLDLYGKVLVRGEQPSHFEEQADKQGEWLANAALQFLKESHGTLPPITGAGLALEGYIFSQHASFRHAIDTESIRQSLEDALGVPVNTGTDSRLVTIAEQRFGAAKGAKNAAIFNMRDGLGLGCLLDGKLVIGEQGFAGEIGHVPLGDNGIPCYCGSSGCLENIVSGSGLARMAVHAGLFPNEKKFDIKSLIELSKKDKAAAAVVAKFVSHLALAVIMTANMFNPEVIVVSGPAGYLIAELHSDLVAAVKDAGVPFILEKTKIAISTLGEDTVLLGAGGLILNHIYSAAHIDAESLL